MHAQRLDDVLAESEPRMRAYFRRRCRSADEVDDLVQESMVAVLTSLERFAGRSSIHTWIYAICRNVYRNHLYYAARDWALARKMSEPDDTLPRLGEEHDEAVTTIRSLVGALPRRERDLYRLYYVEGRPVLEIARITGRPAGTVKYLLHKLRGHLRALLEPGLPAAGTADPPTTGGRHPAGNEMRPDRLRYPASPDSSSHSAR